MYPHKNILYIYIYIYIMQKVSTDDLSSRNNSTALGQYDIWSSLRNVFITTIKTILYSLKELFGIV